MKRHHSNRYRPDIDGLRAVAILSVLGFHAFPEYLSGGFIGVDIFFVISGYLITEIILNNISRNEFGFRDFYVRRVKRIFPALLVILVACTFAGWLLLLPEDLVQLSKHLMGGASFFSNIILYGESGYFDSSSDLKPLLHLWSLGVEEQFYLIWPIMLFFFLKLKRSLLGLTSVALGSSFLLNIVSSSNHQVFSFYLPLTRFWELSLGSALVMAEAHLRVELKENAAIQKLLGKVSEFANITAAIGFAAILAGVLLINSNLTFPGWWALLPTGGALLIIAAGGGSFVNKYLLANKVMVGIGLISYPLYLWHWPLISFAHILTQSTSLPPLMAGVLVVLSVVLAWLTYRYIEVPIRFSKGRKLIVQVLVGLMLVVFGVSLSIFKGDGFPQRIPEEVRGYSKMKFADFHWDELVRTGSCNIQEPQLASHPLECIEKVRPLVMLWGDSYAASLYPGLKSLQNKFNFGIAQFTSSACPPILDLNMVTAYRKNCSEINQNNLDALGAMSPEIILLQTTWKSEDYQLPAGEFLNQLRPTIMKIKSRSPHSRIIVIGPVPRWQESPAKCLTRYYMQHHQAAPEKMRFCLKEGTEQLDQQLNALASSMQIDYISAWNAMCDANGCLDRVGPNADQVTSIDGGHLSNAGSEYLMSRIATQIFKSQ